MIRFNRKQLVEAQEKSYMYKAKDIIALLIIAQIVTLVVSILLAILISYTAALVLEAAIMGVTSYIYVSESRKLERICKGENQPFQGMEIRIGESVILIEGQLCDEVDTDEKALSFATRSGAGNLKISTENIEEETEIIEIKIKDYLNIKTSKDELKEAKNIKKNKKKKRDIAANNDENNCITNTEKTDHSKYSVTYHVEINEIKKAREHKGFLVIIMNDRSEIKVPVDNENQKFYEKLALLSGSNYKTIC